MEKSNVTTAALDLQQTWPLPSVMRPITIVGAGDIVKTAHLPAYRKLGFPIAGIFDLNKRAAQLLAQEFDVARVFESLDEAIEKSGNQGVYDIALPPAAVLPTVSELPKGSVALIQKPIGENLAETRRIISALDSRNIIAAANFQLRFTPSMLAIQDECDVEFWDPSWMSMCTWRCTCPGKTGPLFQRWTPLRFPYILSTIWIGSVRCSVNLPAFLQNLSQIHGIRI